MIDPLDTENRFAEAQRQIMQAVFQTHSGQLGHAYMNGYFTTFSQVLFRKLTKRDQAFFLQQVERDAARLQALANLTV